MFSIQHGLQYRGNNVTLKEAKVQAIGNEIAVQASSSVTATTSMLLDTVENRCEMKDICITINNTSATDANATVTVS